MTSHDAQFGQLLRTWRDRARPGDLGLPAGGTRRVPGLRREEVAALADLSVDYIMRLEQGRADNPSPAVVAALGRALLLSRAELDHFYRLAGHLPPSDLVVPSHITPGVRRLLSRMPNTPIAVYDAAWTLLTHNTLWRAIFEHSPVGRAGNVVWTTFTHTGPPPVADPKEFARFQRALVADLRRTSGRYPHDAFVRQLVTDLLEADPVFAALWADGVVTAFASERKTIHHPTAGHLILDCDVLTSVEDDLRIVSYTAPLGSDTADRLTLLALDPDTTPSLRA